MEKKRGTVLITGAAGGMGKAASVLLSEQGYRVIGLDRRVPECREGENWPLFSCDITSEESLSEVFSKISEMLAENGEKLQAVIHHAGMYEFGSLAEMSREEFEKVFQVNLFGVAAVNRIFLPLVEKRGRIVITTSELGVLDPLPFTGIYAISKAALERYAFSLRMELQLLEIDVAVIRPGAVSTGLLDISRNRIDRFCRETKLYACNAEKFRKITETVEARAVPPERIARADLKILRARRPKLVTKINRSPLLLLLNLLPDRVQTDILRKILK